MADKPAPEPAFAVMLRPDIQRPLSLGDHALTPGQQLPLQDGQLVDALLTHPNSLIPIRDGVSVSRDEAIRFLTERLKRKNEERSKPRVPVHHGIVDPATDEGEKGPGLTLVEMVALPDKALDLPPLTETTNKTELQAFVDKFKLGRPPLRSTIADIHKSLESYIEVIKDTRLQEKQRALDNATHALDAERAGAAFIAPPPPPASTASPQLPAQPVAEVVPTPTEEAPAESPADESHADEPAGDEKSADRPARGGRSRHR